MTKWIVSLLFFMNIGSAFGHQPDVSSLMLIEKDSQTWILQMRASLTAFEYEIETHYGAKSYKSPKEFNVLVLEYVKNNISIRCNDLTNVSLLNGYVNLGHETSVVFEISGFTENLHGLHIQNTSFKDIHKNQCALIVLKKDVVQNQFILDNKNQHTANLELSGNTFQLINQNPVFAFLSIEFILPLIFVGLLSLAFWFWKTNKRKQTQQGFL